MIKKIWHYLVKMIQNHFALKEYPECDTLDWAPFQKPRAGQRGVLSRPSAHRNRRYAAGRGNKDNREE